MLRIFKGLKIRRLQADVSEERKLEIRCFIVLITDGIRKPFEYLYTVPRPSFEFVCLIALFE